VCNVIVESRTSADAIDRRWLSYGVYLAVPGWHEWRIGGSVCSYKASGWPYDRRSGRLIAKSDRFPPIGPFVVTSDGNRFRRGWNRYLPIFRGTAGGAGKGRNAERERERERERNGVRALTNEPGLWEMRDDYVV